MEAERGKHERQGYGLRAVPLGEGWASCTNQHHCLHVHAQMHGQHVPELCNAIYNCIFNRFWVLPCCLATL